MILGIGNQAYEQLLLREWGSIGLLLKDGLPNAILETSPNFYSDLKVDNSDKGLSREARSGNLKLPIIFGGETATEGILKVAKEVKGFWC